MTPATLTTALLWTQVFLLLIIFSGIFVLRAGEARFSMFSYNPRLATTMLPFLVLGFSLTTLSILVFSQDFILLTKPIFGDVILPNINRNNAFLSVFLLDIFGTAFLIWITGGSKDSPFSATLFNLPALSIFLRETPQRFFLYTSLTVFLFILLSRKNGLSRAVLENTRHNLAFQIVSLGCLALATLVGYITRPV